MSAVWKFFKKTPEKDICKICSKGIKHVGNTTNLRNHLIRVHKINLDNEQDDNRENSGNKMKKKLESYFKSSNSEEKECEIEESDNGAKKAKANNNNNSNDLELEYNKSEEVKCQQITIENAIKQINSYTEESGIKFNAILNAIMFFTCKENLPFNLIESEAFKHLMRVTCPKFNMPCSKSLKFRIEEKYEVLSQLMKAKLKAVERLAVTTDIWTHTQSTTSYLGITFHYLENFEAKTVCAGAIEMSESHTSENISDCLMSVLQMWEIDRSKIIAIVTDNASNIVKAAETFVGRNWHFGCFAHTLNLVLTNATEGCEEIASIITQVKKIVTYFKQSVKAADALRKLNSEKLKQSCPTRWNSSFEMIERFLKVSDDINTVLFSMPSSSTTVKTPDMINTSNMQILKEVKEILKPFAEVTNELSSETNVTSSKIVPMCFLLKKQLEEIHVSSFSTNKLKINLRNEMKKRFLPYENNKVLIISTMLDPRFKTDNFADCALTAANALSLIKEEINSQKQSFSSNEEQTSSQQENTPKSALFSSIWSLQKEIQNEQNKMRNERLNVNMELTIYKNEATNLFINPLEFWQDEGLKFPRLRKLAEKYLLIPATSVPCERVFSKAGNILTDKRSRMKPKWLQKLLFLNSLDKNFFLQSK